MTTANQAAPSPSATATPRLLRARNPWLLGGGWFSLIFAVFQVSAIWWPPSALRYFGGPVRLQATSPGVYAAVCVAVGVAVAVCGLYALSGAGQGRRPPLLRSALVAITAIYLLRGLQVITDMVLISRHPDAGLGRFAVFSLIALVVGLIHLAGVIRLFRSSRPVEGGVAV